MRHPALRRSARHSKRDSGPASSKNGPPEAQDPSTQDHHDPSAQNRIAPNTPPDGEFNQGGVRPEGLEYQRDLGSEQDA
jgi:hypothetical protein